MKKLKFILTGIFFGIVLTQSELVSWFRWQEMFRLESFQLFGILLSAMISGAVIVTVIKFSGLKDINDKPITFRKRSKTLWRYLLGGGAFGMGWALAGFPGAQFVLLGQGSLAILVTLAGAILGTYTYGKVRQNLPH